MELQKKFLKDAEKISFDLEHRRKLQHNISKYNIKVEEGKKQFADLELARKRAANQKHKILYDLDKYLIEFEVAFEKNGGKVIWASTHKDAVREILSILKKRKARSVVKSKSMMTEELELNESLKSERLKLLRPTLANSSCSSPAKSHIIS
jgi:L-lactate dehydrogenase complex protein LldF